MRRLAAVPLLTLLASACDAGGDRSTADPASPAATPAPAAAAVSLVDSTIPPAVAGEGGWDYQQSVRADLDGDGAQERVVLTARVELIRGRPAWDDGQPWQVYVEAPDGTRTYLYARRLQLGTLTARVGVPEPGRGPSVVLLEHLPDALRLYEVEYTGTGRTEVRERFGRMLDPTGDFAGPSLP
jgi:hypothetical protein